MSQCAYAKVEEGAITIIVQVQPSTNNDSSSWKYWFRWVADTPAKWMRMPVIYIKRIAWPTNHRWATKWDPIQPAMQSDHCLSFILNTESTLYLSVCSLSQTQCTSKYALLLLWNLVKWAEDSNQNRNKRSKWLLFGFFVESCVFGLSTSAGRFIGLSVPNSWPCVQLQQ